MAGNGDRLKQAAFWAVSTLIVISSWYPFRLDLPQQIVNTAVQRPDGAWDLDGNSRVISPAPAAAAALGSARQFRLTVEAIPAKRDQTGPARLVSIAADPYRSSLMLGIDGEDVVLYLACGGASNVDSSWRLPRDSEHRLAVSVWIEQADDRFDLAMQVNNQPRMSLERQCPTGTLPALQDATAPWALGNVYSGHRPFVGRLVKVEVSHDGRNMDLLRAVSWQVPKTFWLLPERLYQPSSNVGHEVAVALWHVSSFALLGFLLAGMTQRRKTAQLVAAVVVFAAMLNGGKALIAGRHPSVVDLLLNVAGAVTSLWLRRHLTDANAAMARHDA